MFNFFSSFKKDVKDFIANAEARFKSLEAKVESLVGISNNKEQAPAPVEAPAVNPTTTPAAVTPAETASGASSTEPN